MNAVARNFLNTTGVYVEEGTGDDGVMAGC